MRELIFLKYLKNTTQAHETYRIQTRTGGVVLMSSDEYENLLETMELLSIPGFRGEYFSFIGAGYKKRRNLFDEGYFW